MRYLAIAITIGLTGIMSGCTMSYLGSVGSYEPGYIYSGYGPAYIGQTGMYGFAPRAANVKQRDHSRLAGERADR